MCCTGGVQSSGVTITGAGCRSDPPSPTSPEDAEIPQASGQEGGHRCSGPGKVNLSLETDRLAGGLVHVRVSASITRKRAL